MAELGRGVSEATRSAAPAAAAKTVAASRKLRVLVMDDEDHIRYIAKSMLELCAHEVETVPDGDAAVDAYRRALDGQRPFDVVILDLVVSSGLGGLEAMHRLLGVDPGVRAIVCSGTLKEPLRAYREFGFCGALAKPFRLHDIQHMVTTAHERSEAFTCRVPWVI